ncbi:MAG: hypothetical protein ABH826_00500 [Patescibacteria group bacterium]
MHEPEYEGDVLVAKQSNHNGRKSRVINEYNAEGLLISRSRYAPPDAKKPYTRKHYKYDEHGNLTEVATVGKGKKDVCTFTYTKSGAVKPPSCKEVPPTPDDRRDIVWPPSRPDDEPIMLPPQEPKCWVVKRDCFGDWIIKRCEKGHPPICRAIERDEQQCPGGTQYQQWSCANR